MADNNYRTMFHIMPPKGWLNDPNGLCYYKNMYHVFFQYSPDNANGGDKYWGHYTSDNLVEFKFAGISVSPDTEYDKNGAYSGSAFIKDDELYVYYTGNVKTSGEHDIDRAYSGRTANTILIKSKDGMNFGNKKLLMNNDDYPNEYTCHVKMVQSVIQKMHRQRIIMLLKKLLILRGQETHLLVHFYGSLQMMVLDMAILIHYLMKAFINILNFQINTVLQVL